MPEMPDEARARRLAEAVARIQKESMPDPAPNIPVTIVGAPDSVTKGTVVPTPGVAPNIVIAAVVSPIAAILIRFTNTFLTTLVGLVLAGMTPAGAETLQAHDFLHLVLKCASLSVAGAGVGLLKDLVTVFGKLEGKYPLLTGSV